MTMTIDGGDLGDGWICSMKMLKNGLEVDGFATSRTPIQSPRSTKRVVVPRCAARPPEPPAQVHPDHHAEDGAVAVAEHADGAEPVDEVVVLRKQKKGIKTVASLPPSQNVWPLWTYDGPQTQTQTHHDWTSPTRQTTTARDLQSSGGCLASSHCGDWQSRLWNHQSPRRASTKASQENIR